MGTSGLVGPSLIFFASCFVLRRGNQTSRRGKERRRSNYTLQVLNEEGNRWHQSIAQPWEGATQPVWRHPVEPQLIRRRLRPGRRRCDSTPDPIDAELGRRRPIQRNFRGTS
ncbi:hypothetical protein CIHG_04050 [Coccidioides immitis H538.4]|uniref:Uncharacterized protein n=2 Tax=Coccidioides immitis TaxID=5501 RepID=A0A0J8RN98_COCIT|nr:hypothetical protein CIRG_04449 [Coccidioides immitis RMSCC 2394]KMU86262.1 hypothetical protein CIHG_04050 [Coccidioides immitis H538.4]